MTLIAASIAVHEPDDIGLSLSRAADAAESGANLIEWRIDGLAQNHEVMDEVANLAQQLVRESPLPCIVTCRIATEGGEYSGDEQSRAALYESMVGSDHRPRYIDVEWAAMRRSPSTWASLRSCLKVEQSRSDLHTGLILSTHDFTSRPADLLQRIEGMSRDPLCAAVKVAWQARSLRDNLEAFDLLRDRHKPMIALCMGQFGLMSRVLAPKFDGFLTFAVDQEMEVTAPGQPTIDELKKLYRFDRIGKSTRVYGVIGWPVSHSQGPAIHNAGFTTTGFDGVYLPLPIPGGPVEYEHFKATVGALIDHPSLNFCGASVTIPHKENLLRFVKERGGRVDPLVERIGAANTLIVPSEFSGLECINTDAPAAIHSLCAGMGINRNEFGNLRIAVIGAGGVARAVIPGLVECGANVTIFNRSLERATRLAAEFSIREAASGVEAKLLDLIARERFDVLINCTPIGMHGGPAPDELPIPTSVVLDESVTVFDTVYTPPRTPLIQQAEARGAKTITGVDMFVLQATLQFEKWTGTPGPRETFERALSRSAHPT